MKLPGVVRPPDLPLAGARIPAVVVRAVFAIAGVLLSLVDYGLTGWLAVGVVLSVAAACVAAVPARVGADPVPGGRPVSPPRRA